MSNNIQRTGEERQHEVDILWQKLLELGIPASLACMQTIRAEFDGYVVDGETRNLKIRLPCFKRIFCALLPAKRRHQVSAMLEFAPDV